MEVTANIMAVGNGGDIHMESTKRSIYEFASRHPPWLLYANFYFIPVLMISYVSVVSGQCRKSLMMFFLVFSIHYFLMMLSPSLMGLIFTTCVESD